jgi:acyl carrier protein
METIMSKIKEGITEIFPAAVGLEIIPDTPLSNIPDWDSMASVNFQVYLEEAFSVEIPTDLLEGGSTIGEIIAHIGKSN